MDGIPERVYFQYRSKPKAVKWFSISESIGNELEKAFGLIRDSYDIATATGAQLDIIAAIVGTARDITRGLVLDTCQFALAANADDSQFGDDVLGQFSGGVVGDDAGLDDAYLRKMILWKIESNQSRVTIEDTLTAIRIVMPELTAVVVDPEDMTFTLNFIGDGPSAIDAQILSIPGIMPTPQGVRFAGYTINGVLYSHGN